MAAARCAILIKTQPDPNRTNFGCKAGENIGECISPKRLMFHVKQRMALGRDCSLVARRAWLPHQIPLPRRRLPRPGLATPAGGPFMAATCSTAARMLTSRGCAYLAVTLGVSCLANA